MKKVVLLSLFICFLLPSSAFGWSAEGDALRKNGFSPEMVRVSNLQKSRMEQQEPAPPERTMFKQAMWNVVHNDWLAPPYKFGEYIIKY